MKYQIKYKPELAESPKYFKTEEQLALQLREDGVDKDNELSDDYIINESYKIGEWDYEILETMYQC